MDFIDWCHHVLQTLEREKFNPHLSDHEIQRVLFGEDVVKRPEFHTSNARHGMFDALDLLLNAGLAEKGQYNWNITPLGRKVLSDPIDYWMEVCQQELDTEERSMLHLVNELSPQQGADPECAWLKDVEREPILAAFNTALPPPQSNEHMGELQKYLYELPKLLADRLFLKSRGSIGYHARLTPTYRGLVWETRRDFTLESKLIDELVREWETTNVDFKRELSLDTKKQKAELAKDVLGLATTKSSGRRYLIVGFDNKTREYHAAPDDMVTQDRIEQILADLTDPVITVRYQVINYRLGKVGKLEVIREPEKLPYRASKDVLIDERGRKGLEKDKVYVRHGSQTEAPTDAELQALEDEGRRARGE